MLTRRLFSNPDRWFWFAVGDKSVARPTSRGLTSPDNAPVQLLWEIGLTIAIPLAFALLVQMALSQ